MSEYVWPEIFTNPGFKLDECTRAEVLAMGLQGWTLCHSGAELPKKALPGGKIYHFGNAMVAIGEFLGCEADECVLNQEADKILAARKG